MTGDEIFKEILAALQSAAEGTDLTLERHPDMRGASVRGLRVQAYVVPARTGFQVELWHHRGSDPYSIVRTEKLAEAAEVAVSEALTVRARREWQARRMNGPTALVVEYERVTGGLPCREAREVDHDDVVS